MLAKITHRKRNRKIFAKYFPRPSRLFHLKIALHIKNSIIL